MIASAQFTIISLCDVVTSNTPPENPYEAVSYTHLKKRTSRVTVSDAELFTRLLYYGLAHLHLSQDEVWLMPFGLLLDLWECHKQYNGQAIPAHEHYIDDIIPDGI